MRRFETLSTTVEMHLRQKVVTGEAGIEQIASDLALSPRTLQRRLHREHTSFRAISNRVRAEVARRMLRETELSVAEISSALGYTDASHFSRAFRQWTGLAPRAFRSEVGTS